MTRNILIIEDDLDIARLVQLHLEDLGCGVQMVADGKAGLRAVRTGRFDLVVLDLTLPDIDGLEICRQIRSGETYVPILMLTARSTETDRVVGLELGADDYLTKPFSVTELVARVKAIFRRIDAVRSESSGTGSQPIRIAGIVIEPDRRRVEVNGSVVDLTAREFDLLVHFARHPGRVFSRTQLLDQVWGYGHGGYAHTVNSHINRLRAKIEPDPAAPTLIETVWGVGYRMHDPVEG
ncbi:MAG: response regulator transcription factor [Acidobacteria bacterium]|uniref:Phosphate regulon transcriptional regulatory protein PhoB n=1 Tax=Candidatus Polarisedimenticola svalbardensis TaxID=2886004 RepID=A0A8J6Y8P9_9BACT|nr:response regulator transcription factor [Candidatus Polarisedimenticola svalbardensis]